MNWAWKMTDRRQPVTALLVCCGNLLHVKICCDVFTSFCGLLGTMLSLCELPASFSVEGARVADDVGMHQGVSSLLPFYSNTGAWPPASRLSMYEVREEHLAASSSDGLIGKYLLNHGRGRLRNQLRTWPLYASAPGGRIILRVREGAGPKLPEDLNTFYLLSCTKSVTTAVPEYR